ncbi:ankyrin repeat and SOCS box protein 16 isoform X3 [Lasioglossum baleicum]|uniref:ankyrin repeat and SOCS box protein 16 isoform X3 n=1 Tax=Lasioglossum baleicum TaxID=434251 RepID=UPI003FCCFCDD
MRFFGKIENKDKEIVHKREKYCAAMTRDAGHETRAKVLAAKASAKRKLRSCRERMNRCAHSRAFPLCYFRAESPFEALNRTDFPTEKTVCNTAGSIWWSTEDYLPTTMCDEPLRLALKNRHVNVARILLEAGANPNKRYFFGSEINLVSPLDLQCMELLLAFGAQPNTRDRAGLTPLMKASRLPQGIASVLLLLSYGADVNSMADARHDYRTVLHYAILGGDPSVIDLLLKQGARLDLGPEYQKPTALDLAILKGDPSIVRMLLRSGADVNATSPIIGSPLHVACADNIPNRLEILSMLLERGADPNLVIRSDEGPALRPVLAEYVASNENASVEVVALLLKYGARVVIKTQFRDPHGILNSLQNTANKPRLLKVLLEAAESFDPCMIRRSSSLTDAQRAIVMEAAGTPLPLTHQARLVVRKLCGNNLPKVVHKLQLPLLLHRYLMYDFH